MAVERSSDFDVWSLPASLSSDAACETRMGRRDIGPRSREIDPRCDEAAAV